MGICSSSKKNPDRLVSLLHEISCENKQQASKYKCVVGFELRGKKLDEYFESPNVYVIIDGKTFSILVEKSDEIDKYAYINSIVKLQYVHEYLKKSKYDYIYNLDLTNIAKPSFIYEENNNVDESENHDINQAKLYFEQNRDSIVITPPMLPKNKKKLDLDDILFGSNLDILDGEPEPKKKTKSKPKEEPIKFTEENKDNIPVPKTLTYDDFAQTQKTSQKVYFEKTLTKMLENSGLDSKTLSENRSNLNTLIERIHFHNLKFRQKNGLPGPKHDAPKKSAQSKTYQLQTKKIVY